MCPYSKKEGQFSRRAKIDPGKAGLAARLRQETTMTMARIAQRLHRGTRHTLTAKLQERNRADE